MVDFVQIVLYGFQYPFNQICLNVTIYKKSN